MVLISGMAKHARLDLQGALNTIPDYRFEAQLEHDVQQNKLSEVADALGQVSKLLGENTAAGKAAPRCGTALK